MKRYNEFINERVNWSVKLVDFAKNGDLEGVKQALDNGANIHYIDSLSLRLASKKGHLEVVKYLIDQGAGSYKHVDHALLVASLNGQLEVVKYLVDQGADIHIDNNIALRYAIGRGHLNIVKYLVEHGAIINDNVMNQASYEIRLYLCEYIIHKKPWYIPKIMKCIPEEIKEKYPHLFAASDMDLL